MEEKTTISEELANRVEIRIRKEIYEKF